MAKLTYKEKYEAYRARIESERPSVYVNEEERIAAKKVYAAKWKEIEEYGRKYYSKRAH